MDLCCLSNSDLCFDSILLALQNQQPSIVVNAFIIATTMPQRPIQRHDRRNSTVDFELTQKS